jgi:formyltetrahydrofolate synthetase
MTLRPVFRGRSQITLLAGLTCVIRTAVPSLLSQVSRFVRLDIDPQAIMWRRVVDINDR